jgi:hypothetical protein
MSPGVMSARSPASFTRPTQPRGCEYREIAFRSENWRLRKILEPGEEVLGSDFVALREVLSGDPVLIVTDRSAYLVLPSETIRLRYSYIAAVARSDGSESSLSAPWLELKARNGKWLRMTFDPRNRQQVTADIITNAVCGQVVRNAGICRVTPHSGYRSPVPIGGARSVPAYPLRPGRGRTQSLRSPHL